MTAHSLDRLWLLSTDVAAQCETSAQADTKSRVLVDGTVVLRRCALYRDAFRYIAVSLPAELLRFEAVAEWARRQRVTVDVTTADELDHAISAGISPRRVVMHLASGTAAPIRRAANAGVGRFVVRSSQQIAIIASCAEQTQRVVVDVTTASAGALASEVLAHHHLDLIGLHCTLGATDDAIGAVRQRGMIPEMARMRRAYGVLLTRVSLAGVDFDEGWLEPRVLRKVGEAIDEVIGDECARYRYPRPALTLSPTPAALLPA
jgi:diaminopimelate decarboxylase